MVAYIIKIENLPTFSGEKTDMLIGFSVVGLAKNTLCYSIRLQQPTVIFNKKSQNPSTTLVLIQIRL